MDPLDEFEFKPLSKGLGFHQKVKTNSEIKKQIASSTVLKTPSVPEKPKSKKQQDVRLPQFQMPDMEIEEESPRSTPKKNKKLFESVTPEQKKRILPTHVMHRTLFSFRATLLDSVFVTAMTLIFLIALLQVTKVDLVAVLFSVNADFMPKLALGVLFSAIYINYLIVCRSFFSCTLGEWAFDIQLGMPKQASSAIYPILVLARVFTIVISGVLLLPLLSLMFRRDLAGDITGLHLYQKSFEA